MKRLIILAVLMLSACSTVPPETYAESVYRVAHVTGEEMVRLGKMSPEKFAELDMRAQLILAGIYVGSATVAQLIEITKQMRAPK